MLVAVNACVTTGPYLPSMQSIYTHLIPNYKS